MLFVKLNVKTFTPLFVVFWAMKRGWAVEIEKELNENTIWFQNLTNSS